MENKLFVGKMNEHLTQVSGTQFKYWGNHILRGSVAMNLDTGEVKQISFNGYISNDLTVRKAIARKWGLPTFRK